MHLMYISKCNFEGHANVTFQNENENKKWKKREKFITKEKSCSHNCFIIIIIIITYLFM